MVRVTREFAERVAGVTQLLKEEEVQDETLRRLTGLGVELIPGSTAAAVTIAGGRGRADVRRIRPAAA
jgi:hypothetical protein